MYSWGLRHIFSVQQPPVLCDLHLQPSLDVQQQLVLLPLPLDVHLHLAEICLQVVDHALQLVQVEVVAALCLPQLAFQGSSLPWALQVQEEGLADSFLPQRLPFMSWVRNVWGGRLHICVIFDSVGFLF